MKSAVDRCVHVFDRRTLCMYSVTVHQTDDTWSFELILSFVVIAFARIWCYCFSTVSLLFVDLLFFFLHSIFWLCINAIYKSISVSIISICRNVCMISFSFFKNKIRCHRRQTMMMTTTALLLFSITTTN